MNERKDPDDADRHYEQKRDDLLELQQEWVAKIMSELRQQNVFKFSSGAGMRVDIIRATLLRHAPKVLP